MLVGYLKRGRQLHLFFEHLADFKAKTDTVRFRMKAFVMYHKARLQILKKQFRIEHAKYQYQL